MRPNGYVSVVWLAVMTTVIGCGGSPKSTQIPPTGLKKRVLLSNQQTNAVNLLDALKDTFTTKNLSASSPTKLVTASGQTTVLDSAQNTITIIDNTKEAVTGTSVLDDLPLDIAITTDGKTAFAAERNVGEVRFVTTSDASVSPVILHIPDARRLVMSPNGTRLLVFSDPQAQISNSIFVIDTAAKTVATITAPQLDQPITAVFGSSETQAFVLNCAGECGSTHGANLPNDASVVSVDFSGVFATPAVPATFGTVVPVPGGATVGLLSSGNLFVAGTPQGPNALTGPGPACPLSRCGALTTINTGTLTAGAPVPITDGLHQKMALANNRLYIGASACTVDPGSAANTVRGCLTIFNTSTPGAKFPQESSFRQNFDVTGLQPISNRNVIYIVQGGELDIFDTATDALATGITQLDVVGRAFDAVQIDP
jgi:hypothetical protein